MTLEIGAKAPDFHAATDTGAVTLKDFAGKNLVLYFYPRDDTPGCTTEAVDFTAHAKAFAKANAAIIGASKDSVAAHAKFRAKHQLGVELASDADGKMCEAYGVWVEKSMYGKKSMGIERATFLIDSKGRIAHIWRKVKVAGHVAEVLAAAQALG